MENLPEAFGRVVMLYVNIEVNGHPVKAFVDSGAQSTIMSAACAEKCGITRLMDTRYSGTAVGVGSAKILGKVHIAQMKFGNSHFPISITILESDGVDFLFGLDTLRRYRCCIDLGKNCLRIDGSGGTEEVQFLGESEIPQSARNHVVGAEDEGSSSSSSSGGAGQKSDSSSV
jgi:DNA damage-inducible protein 1